MELIEQEKSSLFLGKRTISKTQLSKVSNQLSPYQRVTPTSSVNNQYGLEKKKQTFENVIYEFQNIRNQSLTQNLEQKKLSLKFTSRNDKDQSFINKIGGTNIETLQNLKKSSIQVQSKNEQYQYKKNCFSNSSRNSNQHSKIQQSIKNASYQIDYLQEDSKLIVSNDQNSLGKNELVRGIKLKLQNDKEKQEDSSASRKGNYVRQSHKAPTYNDQYSYQENQHRNTKLEFLISGQKLMRNNNQIQTKQEHNLIKIQKYSNTEQTSINKKSIVKYSDGRKTIEEDKSPRNLESLYHKKGSNGLRQSQSPQKLNQDMQNVYYYTQGDKQESGMNKSIHKKNNSNFSSSSIESIMMIRRSEGSKYQNKSQYSEQKVRFSDINQIQQLHKLDTQIGSIHMTNVSDKNLSSIKANEYQIKATETSKNDSSQQLNMQLGRNHDNIHTIENDNLQNSQQNKNLMNVYENKQSLKSRDSLDKFLKKIVVQNDNNTSSPPTNILIQVKGDERLKYNSNTIERIQSDDQNMDQITNYENG